MRPTQTGRTCAVGPGPDPGAEYLYIGDIGDNTNAGAGDRPEINIFRISMPHMDRGAPPPVDQPVAGVETFPLAYPDRARDIETLLVDPGSGEVLLVHKSWSGTGEAVVYRASLAAPGVPVILEEVGQLALAPGEQVTSGDVAPSGDAIAIRTYSQVLLYHRAPGTPLEAALQGAPCARSGPDEKHGESITFAADAQSLYTISEGDKPILHELGGKS